MRAIPFWSKQHKYDPEKTAGAYLTVYLSLCIPILLSLLFVLIEGARMNAIRMQIEIAADTAADSALAEFHRELFRQYDLLMIDTSYGENGSADHLRDHLEYYMQKNFSQSGMLTYGNRDFTNLSVTSLEVTGTRFAADEDCAPLREQIYAYMSAEPAEAVMDKVLANVNQYNGLGLDLTEWSQRKAENEESLRQALTSAEESGDEERQQASDFAESNGIDAEQLKDPYKEINSLLGQPVLRQILEGRTDQVSQVTVDTGKFLSHRVRNEGTGLSVQNSHHYPQADAIVFDQYIYEKCGNYQNLLEKSRLKYQIEYLLYGEEADAENLEKTAETMFLIRLAANYMTLCSDAGRTAEAGVWAGVISTFLLSPEIEELIRTALLLSWSYTETLQDMKTLFAGGKVPLVKSDAQWKTRLVYIFTPGLSTKADTGGTGLNYEDYLRILLFLENGNMKNVRLMDLMEMDIRETEGNAAFRMDWCLDSFSMETEAESSFGYSYRIEKEVTYN